MGFLHRNTKEKTLLASFLKALNVKYTRNFTNQLYLTHPHKDNIWGLSQMLSHYRIENSCIKLDPQTYDLQSLPTPFLSIINDDFVIVTRVTEGGTHYIHHKYNGFVYRDDFMKNWNGVLLLATPDEASIEPGYLKHKIQDLFQVGRWVVLFGFVLYAMINLSLLNGVFNQVRSALLLLVNFIGIYISYLLIEKQLFIKNSAADKICHFLKNGNCSEVLTSSAAKLFGVIGWSEIGFAYFCGNLLLLLLFQQWLPFLALINICALPYSFWSVWYQKTQVKSWCTLCLVVQVLLWVIFILCTAFGYVVLPVFSISALFAVAGVYIVPLLLTHMLISLVEDSDKLKKMTLENSRVKYREEVFTLLLKREQKYDVNINNSSILFGNQKANVLITVVSNPLCEGCALMHAQLDKLLHSSKREEICVQYLFKSFIPEVSSVCMSLMAAYHNRPEEAEGVFKVWYAEKTSRTRLLDQYKAALDAENLKKEFDTHEQFIARNNITRTPLVLLNGYQLPSLYTIDDLSYFNINDIKL